MTTAVVTGAGSGIGLACVQRVRELADVVFAVDLRAPEIDGTTGVACDISDPAAVRALARQVTECGPFRALIHAAGISPTMGDARRVFEVNLVGTVLLLDAFDDLVGPESAAVCFASSSAYQVGPHVTADHDALLSDPLASDFLARATALVPDSGFAYGLSKVGVMRAVRRAAVGWGPRGGRVNSLSPGVIDTPMGRLELENRPSLQLMVEQTPLGRTGDSGVVAAVAAFLVSDEASFISGIDVLVDGGGAAGLGLK
jgi:NAD(P)-dependent dehydrogenase (short-subunit alcohol dehydrogenase family)